MFTQARQAVLNELGKNFDKKKLEERQELAKLFEKNASALLHNFDKDGSFNKALAHGIVAEISSQIAGNKAGSGFAAGAINEALINKIDKWAGGDPSKMQWISAALGATVNAATGSNISTGAMVAQYGTKWNRLFGAEQKNVDYVIKYKVLTGKMSEKEFLEYLQEMDSLSKSNDEEQEMMDRQLKKDGVIYVYGEMNILNPELMNEVAQHMGVSFKYDMDNSPTNNIKHLILALEKQYNSTESNEYKGEDWGKSFVSNVISAKTDLIPNVLISEGYGGRGLKYLGKAGGFIGVSMAMNSIYNDYQKYDGMDFAIAMGSDLLPLEGGAIGGMIGGSFGVVGAPSGAITGGMLGDYAQYWVRNQFFNYYKEKQEMEKDNNGK